MADYQFNHAPGTDATAPLFVLFHGTGGDEHQFFDLGAQLLPGARIVTPRGDVSEGGALRYFRRTGEGVYDMADLAVRTAAMIDFVRARAAEGTPRKIVGLGYSNGANILAAVQFAAPELFDASVLMHPLIPFVPAAADFTGKAVLITAGQRDPMASVTATQALADYFTANHATASVHWHSGGHELRQDELVAAQGFLAKVIG